MGARTAHRNASAQELEADLKKAERDPKGKPSPRLIERVKQIVATSQDWKDLWECLCDKDSGGSCEPEEQTAGTIRVFLDEFKTLAVDDAKLEFEGQEQEQQQEQEEEQQQELGLENEWERDRNEEPEHVAPKENKAESTRGRVVSPPAGRRKATPSLAPGIARTQPAPPAPPVPPAPPATLPTKQRPGPSVAPRVRGSAGKQMQDDDDDVPPWRKPEPTARKEPQSHKGPTADREPSDPRPPPPPRGSASRPAPSSSADVPRPSSVPGIADAPAAYPVMPMWHGPSHAALVEDVKSLQKNNPDMREAWRGFCAYAGHAGRFDPAAHAPEFLEAFLGQAQSMLAGFDALVARVKTVQRSSQLAMSAWHDYCDREANGQRNPAKHQAWFLQRFLHEVMYHVSLAADPPPEELVAEVKDAQRSTPGGRDLWEQFVDRAGVATRDPSKHEGWFLRSFLAELRGSPQEAGSRKRPRSPAREGSEDSAMQDAAQQDDAQQDVAQQGKGEGVNDGADERDAVVNLMVRNLHPDTEDVDLEWHFADHGAVLEAKVARDDDGKNLGHGHVSLETFEDGDQDELLGSAHTIRGQEVIVELQHGGRPSKNRRDKGKAPTPAKEEPVPQTKVYVCGLAEGCSEEEFRDLFKEFGKITAIVIPDQKPGKRYGFVTYSTVEEAAEAVDTMNGFNHDGAELEVRFAQPRRRTDRRSGAKDSKGGGHGGPAGADRRAPMGKAGRKKQRQRGGPSAPAGPAAMLPPAGGNANGFYLQRVYAMAAMYACGSAPQMQPVPPAPQRKNVFKPKSRT